MTYMTSATPITTMRMVIIPAPLSYPEIPHIPMPIQILHSTVVHKPSTNTQRVEQEVPIITMDSTPASPIPSTSAAPLRIPTPPPHCPTTVLVPVPPKPHVYATIAMLEHDPSPSPSPSPSPEPIANPATAPPPPSPSTPPTSAPSQGASTDVSSTALVQASAPPEEAVSYTHLTLPTIYTV